MSRPRFLDICLLLLLLHQNYGSPSSSSSLALPVTSSESRSSPNRNLKSARRLQIPVTSIAPTRSSSTWPSLAALGGEASIVPEIVEVEENWSKKMQTFRLPPVLTVNKSAAYALYELTYIRDVAYKPEEYHVKTRKWSQMQMQML